MPSEWRELLDPSTDTFWKEGNHIPDQGFLIFLKNPTIENARRWLLRVEKKALIMEKVMELSLTAEKQLLIEGKLKDRKGILKYEKGFLAGVKKIESQALNSNDIKKISSDLNYYFIFHSKCGHCASLAKKLTSFNNVFPLQANDGTLKNWENLPSTAKADAETLKEYVKENTFPVLLIHSKKTNKATTVVGDKSLSEIIEASRKVLL